MEYLTIKLREILPSVLKDLTFDRILARVKSASVVEMVVTAIIIFWTYNHITFSAPSSSSAKSAGETDGGRVDPTLVVFDDREEAIYKKLFHNIDSDNSGGIDFEELYTCLVGHFNAPKHITPAVVLNMMNEADLNCNGVLDLEEFIFIMKNAKSSKYWKNTTSSLWGELTLSVQSAADFTEDVLAPIHHILRVHSHPLVENGTYRGTVPPVYGRIIFVVFGFILSALTLFLLWVIVPLTSWKRGKDVNGFIFGYHYVSDPPHALSPLARLTQKVISPSNMTLLMLLKLVLSAGIPIGIGYLATQYSHLYRPGNVTLESDPLQFFFWNACPVLAYYLVDTWVFLQTLRHQDIAERALLGVLAVMD